MGAKEDRRRNQRRRLFQRDGWQDSAGDWFAMCAAGCGAVLSWEEAGRRKRNQTVEGKPDSNYELVCKAGCDPYRAARLKRTWRLNARTDALFANAVRRPS